MELEAAMPELVDVSSESDSDDSDDSSGDEADDEDDSEVEGLDLDDIELKSQPGLGQAVRQELKEMFSQRYVHINTK